MFILSLDTYKNDYYNLIIMEGKLEGEGAEYEGGGE